MVLSRNGHGAGAGVGAGGASAVLVPVLVLVDLVLVFFLVSLLLLLLPPQALLPALLLLSVVSASLPIAEPRLSNVLNNQLLSFVFFMLVTATLRATSPKPWWDASSNSTPAIDVDLRVFRHVTLGFRQCFVEIEAWPKMSSNIHPCR